MPYDKNGKYYRKPVYKVEKTKKDLPQGKNFSKGGACGCLIAIFSIPPIAFLIWVSGTFDPPPPPPKKEYQPSLVKEVKNGLLKGTDQCVRRHENNQSTKFADVPAFLKLYEGYDIKPAKTFGIKRGSCFAAKAIPKSEENTWFSIYRVKHDLEFRLTYWLIAWNRNLRRSKWAGTSRSCGDETKPGCGSEWGWSAELIDQKQNSKDAYTGSVKINCDSPVWKNRPKCN